MDRARIAILGTGGIGGYFGAKLACAGQDVTFVARGGQLEALRRDGLHVASSEGDLHVTPCRATDDPGGIGPVDFVLHATKLPALAENPAFVAPLVGPGTLVVTLQNGVDAPALLADAIGASHVMGGLALVSAHIVAPGRIEQVGRMNRIEFGPTTGQSDDRAARLDAILKASGIDSLVADDIRASLWRKFCVLASGAAMVTATDRCYGDVREDPETRAMLRAAIAEAAAVAAAEGVPLGDGYVDGALATIDGLPHEMVASMTVDRRRGRRLELDWFSGTIVRLGDRHGIETPSHRALWTLLKLDRLGHDRAAGARH